MSLLKHITTGGWSPIVKRIGQSAIVIFNVFFGPMPVPVQLSVWPRVIIALAIVASLPLLAAMRKPPWRLKTTGLAALLVVAGLTFGIWYWLTMPTRTMYVRGESYVVATPTGETLEQLHKHGLRVDAADISRLIEGQANRSVEFFFDSAGLATNKLFLAILYILFLAPTTVGVMILLEWITITRAQQ